MGAYPISPRVNMIDSWLYCHGKFLQKREHSSIFGRLFVASFHYMPSKMNTPFLNFFCLHTDALVSFESDFQMLFEQAADQSVSVVITGLPAGGNEIPLVVSLSAETLGSLAAPATSMFFISVCLPVHLSLSLLVSISVCLLSTMPVTVCLLFVSDPVCRSLSVSVYCLFVVCLFSVGVYLLCICCLSVVCRFLCCLSVVSLLLSVVYQRLSVVHLLSVCCLSVSACCLSVVFLLSLCCLSVVSMSVSNPVCLSYFSSCPPTTNFAFCYHS